jgi:hypothetical protein
MAGATDLAAHRLARLSLIQACYQGALKPLAAASLLNSFGFLSIQASPLNALKAADPHGR